MDDTILHKIAAMGGTRCDIEARGILINMTVEPKLFQ